MNKKINFIIGGIVAIALLVSIGLMNTSKQSPNAGSVDRNSSYQSDNLVSNTASTSEKSAPGTLGSVVFTATSAQTVTLYDVADANNWASTTLSTKIISFATSTPAGTYTMDINFFKGLTAVTPVTPTVESMVTWR